MSYGVIQPPVVVTGTTGWDQIGASPAAGKVRSYTLRATNIGSADAYANVRLNNGAGLTIRRAINFPVRFQDLDSAPDLESALPLPAGWFIEVMASAANTIEFSLIQVEDDA